MRRHALYALALLASGCHEYVMVAEPAPLRPILVAPSRGRLPVEPLPKSYKFRVAVLDFIDQTNAAGDLVRTIPDILTTTLFGVGRYEIYDRGQLRDKSPKEVEKIIENKLRGECQTVGNQIFCLPPIIDGEIIGSITRFSPNDKQMTIDLRLISSQSGAVMFATQHTLRYTGILDVKVERDDITALCDQIKNAIPVLPDARIASKNGDEIVINAGDLTGVKKGMALLVYATGDTLRDPGTGDDLTSRIIVGEAHVTAVEERISRATLLRRRQQNVRQGDLVHFK